MRFDYLNPFASSSKPVRLKIEADVAEHRERPRCIDPGLIVEEDTQDFYDPTDEPLIESILDPDGLPELGHITWNRKQFAVLNTRLLPMVDVDFVMEPKADVRYGTGKFVGEYCTLDQVKEACCYLTSGAQSPEEFPASQASVLASLTKLYEGAHRLLLLDARLLEIGIFSTFNGCRLVLNRRITGPLAGAVMQFLYCDPQYLEMMEAYKGIHRARLTKKQGRGEVGPVMTLLGTVKEGIFRGGVEPTFTEPSLRNLYEILTANRDYRAPAGDVTA
jgi:hypothetical protein